jgi:UDP-N-acetylglucosamine transferase subunit ALG13
MIFVTIGTSEPFDRLLHGLEEWAGEELVVQGGASTVRPSNSTWIDFVPFDELTHYMQRARVVVMHAGVGSVLAALGAGKRPIVVPRVRRFGEAVDDHQLVFARRLSTAGLVTLVEDPAALPAAIEAARPEAVSLRQATGLADDLRAFLTSTIRA